MIRFFAKLLLLLFPVALLFVFASTSAAPPNFVNESLILDLNEPTAITFLPDGRMLILERYGRIHVVQAGATQVNSTPFLQITNINTDEGERGLTGIALDPNFSTTGFFYVFYTSNSPLLDRVSRFRVNAANPNIADAGSEAIIWQDNAPAPAFHHGGAIAFGPDGMLYISIGDGADNPNASQNLSSFRGKLLRISSNGSIPTDNPFYDDAGPNYDAIWTRGLRNPFRFSFDPQTGRMYIGDVGANDPATSLEEINLGTAGANYGWPICEADNCASPLQGHVPPIFSYPHSNRDASVTGGFIYRGSQFPPAYQGTYFYGDYVQNWVRRLTFAADGTVSSSLNFEPDDGISDGPYGEIVDLKQGPEGALYYVDIGISWEGTARSGTVRRIIYTGANQPPQIVSASASPTSGPGPTLLVNFTSVASDPEGSTLTYTWNFGDGGTASGAIVSHTYTRRGQYVARLTVSDGVNQTLSNPITITVGAPPVAAITSPIGGSTFRGGDVITYSGTATDPDGALSASNFSWSIVLIHLSHTHPVQGPINRVTSGTFTIPTSEHELNNDTQFQFILTVTDANGLTDTEAVTISPETVDLSFNSQPPGFVLNVDGLPRVAPFTLNSLIGFQHIIDAPVQQQLGGVNYVFMSWSDGGAPIHTISALDSPQTYTANFQLPPPTATALLPTATATNTIPAPPPAFTYQPTATYTPTPTYTPTLSPTPATPPTDTPTWSPTPSETPSPTYTTYLLPTATATNTPLPLPPPVPP